MVLQKIDRGKDVLNHPECLQELVVSECSRFMRRLISGIAESIQKLCFLGAKTPR